MKKEISGIFSKNTLSSLSFYSGKNKISLNLNNFKNEKFPFLKQSTQYYSSIIQELDNIKQKIKNNNNKISTGQANNHNENIPHKKQSLKHTFENSKPRVKQFSEQKSGINIVKSFFDFSTNNKSTKADNSGFNIKDKFKTENNPNIENFSNKKGVKLRFENKDKNYSKEISEHKSKMNHVKSFFDFSTINKSSKAELFTNNVKQKDNISAGSLSFKQIEEIFNIQNEKTLKTSHIRSLDIGQNYFRYTSPKRKKLLMTLLNSYLKVISEYEAHCLDNFKIALEIFYNGIVNGTNLEVLNIDNPNLDLSREILWHLHSLIIFDRLATQYCRFEYMDYHQYIRDLNAIPKEKRNRSKYVFTSHPTQPNSMDQLLSMQEIMKAIEENDLDYLYQSMKSFVDASQCRKEFKKPSYLEESIVYHKVAIPNLINAFSMAYELGLKDPEDFFEIPGTWIAFDFDNHPEMKLGLITYTHAHMLNVTINCYIKIVLEASILDIEEIQEILEHFQRILRYCKKIQDLSDLVRAKKINKSEFYRDLPIFNLRSIERQITQTLEKLSINEKNYSNKVLETSKKLLSLIKVFKLTGCLGQIRLSGEDLYDINNIKEIIHDILKEISILNNNGNAADMLIIANFLSLTQYNNVKELLQRYNIQGMEIIPLLETFSASNDTDSKITMIASSDTRQRDGLLLTELRVLREYKNNPSKFIYMGQGITAERGGGPFKLLHQKYTALTHAQRKRHIRTIQGFFFTSEYISKDLVFNSVLNGAKYVNLGDDFKPTTEYMDFLFDLDNIVGVPQREMQKTEEFNDLYVKNPYIKTSVDFFNYAGSRELGKEITNVKNSRAIIQAFINSDRCSFTHPELAYWDKISQYHLRKITQYYYDNNPHFIYILYNYAFMIRRYNLEFAADYAKMDTNNKYYEVYLKGYSALKNILTHLGLGLDSFPVGEIYSEHLGLSCDSSLDEVHQKEKAYHYLYKLQNYQIGKYLELKRNNNKDYLEAEYKTKLLQSVLANISQFNGKG